MKALKKILRVGKTHDVLLSNLPIKPGKRVEITICFNEIDEEIKKRDITLLKQLFKETQSLPHIKDLTEKDILNEVSMAQQEI